MSYASFAMYPFEPLRADWERLWSAVHELAPWTPASLRWDGDRARPLVRPGRASWRRRVAGRSLTSAARPASRSSVRSRWRWATPTDIVTAASCWRTSPARSARSSTAGSIAAANAPDSLSGWVSLLAAAVGPGGAWPGQVRWTGGHVESLRAAPRRPCRRDIRRRAQPGLRAPAQPRPGGRPPRGRPRTVGAQPAGRRSCRHAGAPNRRARDAFARAMSEPELSTVRDGLFLDGFVALDDSA